MDLHIGSLTTTSTGTGELEQGLIKLTTLNRITVHDSTFIWYCQRELEVRHFRLGLGYRGLHHQRFSLGRADVCTVAAALAIQRIYLNPELVPFLKTRFHGEDSYKAQVECVRSLANCGSEKDIPFIEEAMKMASPRNVIINAGGSAIEELKTIIRNAYFQYYLRPYQIYRTMMCFNSIKEFITVGLSYAKSYFL